MIRQIVLQISAQWIRLHATRTWQAVLLINCVPLVLITVIARLLATHQGADSDTFAASALSLGNGYAMYATTLILLVAYAIDWGRDFDLRTIQLLAVRGISPIPFVLGRYAMFVGIAVLAWVATRLTVILCSIGFGGMTALSGEIPGPFLLWLGINLITLAVGTLLVILAESAANGTVLVIAYLVLLEGIIPQFLRFLGEATGKPALSTIAQFATFALVRRFGTMEQSAFDPILLALYVVVPLIVAILLLKRRELGRLR
ncbi:MAG: hypothetical protein K8S54_15300 [Spirochaetia bacterium]|nr:hypothetical protein [Spirochaetia bacterium]